MAASPSPSVASTPRTAPRWALALAYAAHVTLLLAVFPPRDMVRDAPWFADDFPTRFRFALTQARLLERGWLTGYDPGFAAGFPECRHLPAGGHVFQLALALFGAHIGYARAFNVMCVLLTASSLPILAWAARAAGLEAAASWVPLVALPVVWTGLPFSFPLTGNAMWLAASAMAIATAAAYRRFLVSGSTRDGVVIALGAAAIATVHEVGASVVLGFAIPWVVVRAGRLDRRRLLGTVAAPLVATVLNLYWLWPFVARREIADSYGSGTVEVLDATFTAFTLVYPTGLPVLLVLYGLAVMGFRRLGTRARPEGTRLLLGTLVALPLAFSFGGYLWKVTAWTEPYRFVVPATLALTLLASIGLAEGDGVWADRCRRIGPWASPILAALLLALCPSNPKIPLHSGLTKEARELVSLLATRADPDRRLLLENSGWEYPHGSWLENLADPGHHYFGTHLPSMLPELTGLELLNGAEIGKPFIRHETVRFESHELEDRPIASWNVAELREVFDRYAVGAVLAWSDESRAALAKVPEVLTPSGGSGAFRLFQVVSPSSRFVAGSGKISSSLDRIELDDLEPEGGRVVLRYHFDPALESDPPVRLERVEVPEDPVGFVALVDPPRHVRLGFHVQEPPLAPSAFGLTSPDEGAASATRRRGAPSRPVRSGARSAHECPGR